MNRKHLNIGLLGFGSMGRTHTWAISAIPFYYRNPPFEARLAGVYTRTERTREDAKSEFGFAKAYSSEDELIADPDIDIIDITTPNIAHYETIKKRSMPESISTVRSRSRRPLRKRMRSRVFRVTRG